MKYPILILVLILSGQTVFSQKPLQSKQIDSLVARTMSTMPLAGIAIAVVKDGKIVHARGYGVSSIKTKEKVDENTLFAIASNSKAFTTAALSILVDEGKISWHDKVVDHIPEFKMYDPYVTANFNIQDLLTHRSGLGLGAGDLMFFPDGSDHGIKDILNGFQYMKPVSAFRTQFDYDNLLYMVAGEVVKRTSGMPWSDFVEKRIMAPLNMKRSVGLYTRLKEIKNVAAPHTAFGSELKQIEPYTKSQDVLAAAGGIYSSVLDLSQWVIMHLNDGKLPDGKQLFSSENHAEMWKPHINMRFNVIPGKRYKSHFTSYGLGWNITDKNGYIEVNHTGGLPGMLSKVAMIPELNVGIIVLTNTDPGGYAFFSITKAILDSYLGLKPEDDIGNSERRLKNNESSADSVVKAVWDAVKIAKSDVKLNDYTGTFRDPWFGDVKVHLKDGRLWFTCVRSPKLNGKMFYYKANTFVVQWDYQDMPADAFAMFQLDEEGRATGITMKAISPATDFSFDFHDLDLKKVH